MSIGDTVLFLQKYSLCPILLTQSLTLGLAKKYRPRLHFTGSDQKVDLEGAMVSFKVNGRSYEIEVPEDTPLLWVLRENLGLTGTKYGCGEALCGVCTVHVNGLALRSCVAPVSSVKGKEVLTIEGLSADGVHPVQQAWIAEDVPQCGYCQSGQIMSAVALLDVNPEPSDEDIDEAMTANLCRCGTYERIRRAIHLAAAMMSGGGKR
jgi:isoquinoline 1-oxidoreductase alpha subunit